VEVEVLDDTEAGDDETEAAVVGEVEELVEEMAEDAAADDEAGGEDG
jgi:hypothetical protein